MTSGSTFSAPLPLRRAAWLLSSLAGLACAAAENDDLLGGNEGGSDSSAGTSGASAGSLNNAGTGSAQGVSGNAGAEGGRAGADSLGGAGGASGQAGGDSGGAGSGGSAAAGSSGGDGGTQAGSGGAGANDGEMGGTASGGIGGAVDEGTAGASDDEGTAGASDDDGMAGAPADDGGDVADVDPSSGCGSANPQLGSSQSPLNVANHQYYVKLPTNYDPNTPYPVIFMFHPTNNPLNWAEQNSGFESNGAKDAAIRVYPGAGNNASGWGSSDVSFFEPLYDEITSKFCADKSRMFAAGESSGGDFSSILGCEFADKLRAIGPCATKPVGGYPLNAAQRSCTGQVTAVIIHGLNDNVVGPENGPATRDFYVALNHCGSMTVPVEGYSDSMSNCVEFQDCDEGYPVIWCQHQDPEYSGTNHGWPKFAGNYLWELFSSY